MAQALSTKQLVTCAEYARMRKAAGLHGGTGAAVFKAIRTGRISLVDNKVDPVVADAEWIRNTRPRVTPEVQREREACKQQRAAERAAERARKSAQNRVAARSRTEKKCSRCDRVMDVSSFYPSGTALDGLGSWCKECQNKHTRQVRQERALSRQRAVRDEVARKRAAGEKACTRCGESKPFSEFRPDPMRSLGVRSACLSCERGDLRAANRRYWQRSDARARAEQYKKDHRHELAANARLRRKLNSMEVSDQYVFRLFTRYTRALKPSHIPKALVEAKRLEILIQRHLKEKL